MRFRTPLFRGSLLVAAIVMGAGTSCAFAQELQYLDTSKGQEAAPAAPAKKSRKSKKAETPADAAAPQAAGAPAGKTGGQAGRPDRQFGELEGWSPGKTPPKPKDKYSSDNEGSSAGSMPVKVGPSGNIGSGFSF